MITLEKEGIAQGYVSIGNEYQKQNQSWFAGRSPSKEQSLDKNRPIVKKEESKKVNITESENSG